MAEQKQMRVLIYKRTHTEDPDMKTGVFGNAECMKRVRSWKFDAVIGVGGIGWEAKSHHIDGLLTWIGIGAHTHEDKNGKDRYPLVFFEHFWCKNQDGPLLEKKYPTLARRMYGKNVRALMVDSSSAEWPEVKEILGLARDAPPSGQLERALQRNSQETCSKCRSSP